MAHPSEEREAAVSPSGSSREVRRGGSHEEKSEPAVPRVEVGFALFEPRLMRPLTVLSGRSSRSAISVWV
jgi:hypothetical protein